MVMDNLRQKQKLKFYKYRYDIISNQLVMVFYRLFFTLFTRTENKG